MTTNADAVRETITALELDEPMFAALTQHVLSLAEQLDAKPGNSVLLRAYLPALKVLMNYGDTDDASEEHRKLLELVRPPVHVRSGSDTEAS